MKKLLTVAILLMYFGVPSIARAQSNFNPEFIVADSAIEDYNSWTRADIQGFLESKGSYLRNYQGEDASGSIKMAADIIYEAAQNYRISPKFILVTLQKEQSLITDDSPTQKQMDWATGYAVCDSCSMSDPKIQKYRGFGKQVDNATGLMRWYYNNTDRSYVKKKDVAIFIDDRQITPQSWATAFLYTYTPHLHGNLNFWRIWDTWFGQVYPNGSLVKSSSSSEYYLLENGKKRHFKNMSILVSRANPKLAMVLPEVELNNYPDGAEIAFANYSLLQAPDGIYLLDYDTLRPFESADTVRKIGYNPEELIDVTAADISGYPRGATITASTTAPAGVIYYVAELADPYFFVKDGVARPIVDKRVVEINFKKLAVEKHKLSELRKLQIEHELVNFANGTLIKIAELNRTYVIEDGKKRPIADNETFGAMGYKRENVTTIDLKLGMTIPDGEQLYLNSSLLSNKNKFLGDSDAPVDDLFKSNLPAYLVAEYPSGRLVAGKNIDIKRPIASITKLLTVFEAVSQNNSPTKTVGYNAKKYYAYRNNLNYKEGEKISQRDLIAATLISSDNTSARMLVGSTALTEDDFIASINDRLANWGADNTRLKDVSGLDAGNVSTPRDLLKILVKVLDTTAIKNNLNVSATTIKGLIGKKSVGHKLATTDQLLLKKNLGYKIVAAKTGYTEEAGACLVMTVESLKDKKRYVIITMGGTAGANRFTEPDRIAKLLVSGKVKLTSE